MSVLRVAFVGAGGVNFGGHNNKWDHASRLERMPGVELVGIADINAQQAEKVLALRKAKQDVGHRWASVQTFTNTIDMLEATKPDCVIIGVPPFAHGCNKSPLEVECAKRGVHMFIEKPISCAAPEDMSDVISAIASATQTKNLIVSVAYMFRYSKAIKKIQELINTFGPPHLFQARYNCAYSDIGAFWFDMQLSGGPVVEQATHFVDLGRLFCGEVDLSTVQAQAIRATDPLGRLSALRKDVDETKVPEERRVPRVTTATWQFESGALGSLIHTVQLHGSKYESELEIIGDGYRITLTDPYDACRLSYIASGQTTPVECKLPDDPYYIEVETFVEACKTRDPSKIASSFMDAFRTHQLTWAIRVASERQRPRPTEQSELRDVAATSS